jgi:hypothetical protein
VADDIEHPERPDERPADDSSVGAPGPVDPGADAASDSPTVGGGRRSRGARRRGRDPRGEVVAEVDAVLAKRHRVVAVRLTELEHLGWRRAAAGDKRGQVGAWVRSVVAAELTRRQGADVPPDDSGDEASAAGSGVRVVLNDSVVRELSQQLVRVGSNLNQVTRLAHIEARSSGLDAAGLGRMVAVIDQTRATIAELDSRLEAMSGS